MLCKNPQILKRNQHPISRSEISQAAVRVLETLEAKGFKAYLVGGCIRDRLLGQQPTDFDVATNAKPEEITKLFRSARIIGRRFRIVHVRFGREIIEVTTFRGEPKTENSKEQISVNGLLVRDNAWGSIEEDALRRDFTVNALYYSLKEQKIYDYTGGFADLKQQTLRLIGDPLTRYQEDPVRLLRALRFSAKLGFQLEEHTQAPMTAAGELLLQVAPARMFDEVLKLLLTSYSARCLELLIQTQLFKFIFPATAAALNKQPSYLPFLMQAMDNTAARIKENKPVTPAFLYAVLLWPGFNEIYQQNLQKGLPAFVAMQEASNQSLARQVKHTAIPKRFSFPLKEIWQLQLRLPKRSKNAALRLLEHPRFRASYDFLLLREAAGEIPADLGDWWTSFQFANPNEQGSLLLEASKQRSHSAKNSTSTKRRRRPRRRNPNRKTTHSNEAT